MRTCAYCKMTAKDLQALPARDKQSYLCYTCYCRAYTSLVDPVLDNLRVAVKAAIQEVK